MATSIDSKAFAKLVTEVKKDLKSGDGQVSRSEQAFADLTGIPWGQIGKAIYLAEVEADPSLKIPATGNAVAKARSQGMRWARIAARCGLSPAKVKALYEDSTGESPDASYTGRGRRFNGSSSSASGSTSKASSKSKTASKASSKSRGVSGRRSSAKTKSAAKAAPAASRGTRGTRGTRASAASDPK